MTVDQLGRAYDAYRRTTASRSVAALLIANAIPLVGVLFFGWSLLTILVIYWLENGIAGLWNVPRIFLARGSAAPTLPPLPDAAAYAATRDPAATARLQADWAKARDAELRVTARATSDIGATPGFVRLFGSAGMPTAGRAALAMFFVAHYGMFWFVHGIFVFALPTFLRAGSGLLPGCGDPDPFGGLQGCDGPFGSLLWTNVAIAGAALFISHGAAFLFNYIGRGQYLTASPTGLMGAAYGRVVVLHLTILIGAFAVALFGSPNWALVILVVLKTGLDLRSHVRQHEREGPSIAGVAPSP